MNREQTEEKIKWIKDTFERRLSYELNLLRVSGPMIVPQNGINDDLGGLHSVTFGTEAGAVFIEQIGKTLPDGSIHDSWATSITS